MDNFFLQALQAQQEVQEGRRGDQGHTDQEGGEACR